MTAVRARLFNRDPAWAVEEYRIATGKVFGLGAAGASSLPCFHSLGLLKFFLAAVRLAPLVETSRAPSRLATIGPLKLCSALLTHPQVAASFPFHKTSLLGFVALFVTKPRTY
jgi:hypothetical protein